MIITAIVLSVSVYLANYAAKKYFGEKIIEENYQKKSSQIKSSIPLVFFSAGLIIYFNYCVNMTITVKEFMVGGFFMTISSIALSIVFCVLLSLNLICIPKTIVLKIDTLFIAPPEQIRRLPAISNSYPNLKFIIAIIISTMMASSIIGIVVVNKYILAIIYDINPYFPSLGDLLVLVIEFFWAALITIGIWKVYDRNGSAK